MIGRLGRRFSGVLAAVVLLGGCGIEMFGGGPPPMPCPRANILAEAADVTFYLPGEGRDLTDVEFEGSISGVGGSYSFDEDTGILTVSMILRIDAMRGPAATSRIINMPFFVAIVDADQNIIAKRVFDSEVEFEDARDRTTVVEELEQTIPLGAAELGSDYELLAGFQLTQSQLEENRKSVNP